MIMLFHWVVDSYIDTSVLEKHTVSNFSPTDGGKYVSSELNHWYVPTWHHNPEQSQHYKMFYNLYSLPKAVRLNQGYKLCMACSKHRRN